MTKQITPANVGKQVTTSGNLYEIELIEPIFKKAMFECKSCLRVHEVEQQGKLLHQPVVCSECGGKTFKILQDESTYTQIQKLKIMMPQTTCIGSVEVRLYGNNCGKYKTGSKITVSGILRVELASKNYYYIDDARILDEREYKCKD